MIEPEAGAGTGNGACTSRLPRGMNFINMLCPGQSEGREVPFAKSVTIRHLNYLLHLYLMRIRFCRVALLLPLVFSWAWALPGGEKSYHHNEKRLLGLIPDLIQTLDVLSGDLAGDIIRGINNNPAIHQAFPGLRDVLRNVKSKQITSEDYVRGLLLAIQHHDQYVKEFAELPPDLQGKMERFIAGERPENILGKRSEFYIPPSPAARHHFTRMEEAGNSASSRAWLNAKRQQSPVVYEDAAKSKVMKVGVILC